MISKEWFLKIKINTKVDIHFIIVSYSLNYKQLKIAIDEIR